MVERDHPRLSIGTQCRLLSIGRSSYYHVPKGETAENLRLMRLIDVQFLETPFYGVKRMTWHLRAEGHAVNEKRVRRLMRKIGLMPIYQLPRTSVRAKGHRNWPYLLRGLRIARPNQVWAADVTYIPLARGLPLSGRHHRLVQPQGALLAPVKHVGGGVLRRSPEPMHLLGSGLRISSTPTKAPSSPPSPSRSGSRTPASGYR
ncbi:MAG: transposase [Hyphomicrobiales bacterium]|nr:transposase [Hyphomicrobiales bacterium]